LNKLQLPFIKLKRAFDFYFYKKKYNWVFPEKISHYAGGLIAKGEYEPEVTFLIKDKLKRGDTFIDIGANVGYFSRLASKIVGKEGRVYSFEAEPNNFHALCLNTETQDNVVTLNFAVSNKTDIVNMNRSDRASSHSLLKTSQDLDGSTFQIPTITISDFISDYHDATDVQFVKIDVEGAELYVLSGLRDLIKEQKIRTILIEYHKIILGSEPNIDLELFGLLFKNYNVFLVEKNGANLIPLKSFDELNRYMISQEVYPDENLNILFESKL